MRGVVEAADIARVLDERVLKASAGAEKRTRLFAGESNRRERSFGVGIGACGNAPDSVEGREIGRRVLDGAGVDPDGFDCGVPGGSGEAQSFRNGLMGDDGRIVISDEGNAERGDP